MQSYPPPPPNYKLSPRTCYEQKKIQSYAPIMSLALINCKLLLMFAISHHCAEADAGREGAEHATSCKC